MIIFLQVPYRRSDSNDVTGRIYDRLSEHFGREVVFKDVDSIPYGVDFRTHLNQSVGNCQVLVAVIGSTWLEVLKERLSHPQDWVRAEIETALGRNIPVIPLLVGGTRMPRADELPNTLEELAYRNAAQARPDPDFHQDLTRLTRRLEEIVGSPESSLHAKRITPSIPAPDALSTLTSPQKSSPLSESRRKFYEMELARKQAELAAVQDDLETSQSKKQELKLKNDAEQLLKDVDELEKKLSN